MIETLKMALWFFVAISILVAIHEFGHFYVARRCGVKVLRFSIGFGSRLFTWKDASGTEFALSALPLGGYVKMLDAREGNVPESERDFAYNYKPVWQRIAILSAGPGANFILAILLYYASFFFQGSFALSPVIGYVEPGSIADHARLEAGQEIVSIDNQPVFSRRQVGLKLVERLGEEGEIHFTVRYPNSDLVYESSAQLDGWLKDAKDPDPIKGLGIQFFLPSGIITGVAENSPAEKAGFTKDDELLTMDGININSLEDWVTYVKARPAQKIDVLVLRKGQEKLLSVIPEAVKESDGSEFGRVGVYLGYAKYPDDMQRHESYGVWSSFHKAVSETWETSGLVLISMKKLVTQEISTKNLSGPIGIAKVAADHAKHGFWSFISLLAYLSVLLGVLNLLPIPILDGGQIFYCIIEWVKGSPLPEKVQVMGFQVGMAIMLGVMVVAFYNDILR